MTSSRQRGPFTVHRTRNATPRDQLSINVRRPRANVVVVEVSGPIDSANVDRLSEVLEARLKSMVRAIVVDLSEVSFLCVDGIMTLVQARLRAESKNKLLSLVTGVRSVDRPLEVVGVAGQFTYCTSPVFEPQTYGVPNQSPPPSSAG